MSTNDGTISNETSNPITESEDMTMFQAARRIGRRNAMADLGEHLSQIESPIIPPTVEQLGPRLQTMSIQN